MFRIRFYTDNALPKPLFGKVVFENNIWRTKMDGSDEMNVAAVAAVAESSKSDSVLSKSAELAEEKPNKDETVVFFSGNPEIDVIKGVLRLYKDNM